MPAKASGDVFVAAMNAQVRTLDETDVPVRLALDASGGTADGRETPVHRMRGAVRRARMTMRLCRPLLDDGWAACLDGELRWLGRLLGAARDAEVLRARLPATALRDRSAPLDPAAAARIEAELTVRLEDARSAVRVALAGPRYRALRSALDGAVCAPRLTGRADRKARRTLRRMAARSWRRLADGRYGVDGAGDLHPTDPDEQWHAVRKRAKQARYAAEIAAPVLRATDGARARALADALKELSDVLGAQQDAVLAAAYWRQVADADPDDHALAITAGRLIERERVAARAARDRLPAVWRAAARATLTAWLPQGPG